MHILLLSPGDSIHTTRFVDVLCESGNTVLLVDRLNPLPDGRKGYSYLPYPSMLGLELFRSRLTNWLGHWLIALQLRWIWKGQRPDILHVNQIDVRAIHCTMAGIHPFVGRCWGSDINSLFDAEFAQSKFRQRIGQALRKMDHVFATSEHMRKRAELIAEKKLHTSIFVLGSDLEKFEQPKDSNSAQLRKKLSIAADTKVLLSVRGMRAIYCQHDVVAAYAEIAAHPELPNSMLLLIRVPGGPNTYAEQIQNQIREAGIEENVIWLDAIPQEEMPDFYAISDVVINYAERDGFASSLLEAAVSRCTVVSGDLPTYGDTFRDAHYLVPPSNPRALAKTLAQVLLESPQELARRQEIAYQRVLEEHNTDAKMRKLNALYSRLVELHVRR